MTRTKFVLPDWINKEDWDGFVKMRAKIKKPLTDRAKDMAIRVLRRLKDIGEDPNLALQFAEYKCNQGIFEVPMWFKKQMGIVTDPGDGDFGNY